MHVRLLLLTLVVGATLALIVCGASAAAKLGDGQYGWLDLAGSFNLAWAVIVVLAAYRTRDLIARLDGQAREMTIRFESVAAHSRDWIWQASLDGIITYSSPGVRTLLGYDPPELIGRSTFELLAPEDHVLGAALLESAQAGSGWSKAEAAWRHFDGRFLKLVGS